MIEVKLEMRQVVDREFRLNDTPRAVLRQGVLLVVPCCSVDRERPMLVKQ